MFNLIQGGGFSPLWSAPQRDEACLMVLGLKSLPQLVTMQGHLTGRTAESARRRYPDFAAADGPLLLREHAHDVLFQQVLRHQPADDLSVCIQRLQVRRARLRRHPERHVEQLPEMWVVGRVFLIMAQCRHVF